MSDSPDTALATVQPGNVKPKRKRTPNPKRPPLLGKRTDTRRIDRAEELYCGLGKGGVPLPYRAIVKQLSKEFGVGEDQAKNYIRCVKDRLKERYASFDPEAEIERLTCMFLDAFATAKSKDDANAMVSATYRCAEMRGLYSRKQQIQAEVKGVGDLFATVFSDVPQTIDGTAEVIDDDKSDHFESAG